MLVVVGELLAADGANDVIRARLGFLKILRVFLLRGERLGLSSKIIEIFLIKKSLILFRELSLFL